MSRKPQGLSQDEQWMKEVASKAVFGNCILSRSPLGDPDRDRDRDEEEDGDADAEQEDEEEEVDAVRKREKKVPRSQADRRVNKWTQDERDKLRAVVGKHGPCNWSAIAKMV